MNLFGTVLTYTAPSCNYRGESAENRTVIQKITKGRHEYAIISPEAIRNAVRETLRELGLPCNRTRLNNEDQLAVSFEDYPDADRYADDFFMGWLIAASAGDKKKIVEELKKKGRNGDSFVYKRDSVLRMNIAVSLEPYRYDSVFTQSPQDLSSKEAKSHKNAEGSQLLHRETVYTAFQYPFALNLNDCRAKPDWTKILLRTLGELNGVSGNHARSYFEFAPASLILRLTNQLVAGYETYGFHITDGDKHTHPEVVGGIQKGDYPGNEFFLGGRIVKDMDESTQKALLKAGTVLERSPQKLMQTVAEKLF